MSDELETTVDPLDNEDLWVRGQVYVNYRRWLEEEEERLPELERSAARARYDHEITQRIRDKTTDPEARKDWDIKVSVAHDIVVTAEQELAEVAESAAYYRAMSAEVEADLGDKAQEYETLLADFGWDEDWEDWEDEEFDEFDEFGMFSPLLLDDEWDEEDEDESVEPGEGG